MENSLANRKNKDIDGGWAWMVLLGCTYLGIFNASIVLIFGLQIGPKTKELNLTDTAIATVFNIYSFFFSLTLFLAVPLTDQFGFRRVTILASLISSVAYMSLTFASSTMYLILMFSIVLGCSAGIVHYSVYTILPRYFDRKRGLALGIFFSTAAVGSIILPLLVRFLIDEYGYIGSVLLYSGFLLNNCVSSSLFREPPKIYPTSNTNPTSNSKTNSNSDTSFLKKSQSSNHLGNPNVERVKELVMSSSGMDLAASATMLSTSVEEHKKGFWKSISNRFLNSMRSLTSTVVLVNGIGHTIFIVGYINFYMLVPYYMIDQGFSYQNAAKTLTIFALSNTGARIANTLISDREWFNVRVAYMIYATISGVFCILFPMVTDLRWFYGTVFCYGFGLGGSISVWLLLLIKTVGIEAYGSAVSACGLIVAFGYLIAGPAFGALKTFSGSYAVSIVACGVMNLLSVAIWFLYPMARNREDSKNNNNLHIQDSLSSKP